MDAARLLKSALETFALLVVLFVVHRALTLTPLSATLDLTPTAAFQAFFVGALSDVWVAALGALLALGIGIILEFLGAPNGAGAVRIVFLLLFGVAAASHQTYVDFFQFQIIPFHLLYLFDLEFLTANGGAVLSLKALANLATLVVGLLGLLILDPLRDTPARRLAIWLGALAFLALVAHNRNIHYRVQWFVPESLQMHPLERLYVHLKSQKMPEPLSLPEARALARQLGSDVKLSAEPTGEELLQLLTRRAGDDTGLMPIARKLKNQLSQAAADGRKPIVLVLLLESLRPAETGAGLTPTLDDVARHGIVFTQAFATGSVTRGAQEAVLCGYLGSRDTSLMRGQVVPQVGCLPDLTAPGGETFWYHGGEGRYDGQLAFWGRHGVSDRLSLQDFPETAPRTGWGVGDATFFRLAATRLAELHGRTKANYLLGMMLSVTNHIPWDVPADAPPGFTPPANATHPSHVTTAYTDAALGELLASLKARGLWRDLLLVIASDHGNNVPPLVDRYGETPQKARLLQSHVNFLVTGGLVDGALAAEGIPSLRVDTVVSQADVAVLIAYVLGISDARFMAENPFRTERALPVLATLEEDLFEPRSLRAWKRGELANAPPDDPAILFYRAFLQYINTWVKPGKVDP